MAIYEIFLHFYIYLKTENRECIRPNIHKTLILPKVGNMTVLPNAGKPGFYGVGLPGRVIWCQPWCLYLKAMIRVHDKYFQYCKILSLVVYMVVTSYIQITNDIQYLITF